MTSVAVVAHSAKRLGGGLAELRDLLSAEGVTDPIWAEVPKSKFAPGRVREALDEGADLVFVWGGDGTVQRSLGELAGSPASLAILPAGTVNLLATNLGIPRELEAAVRVGLHGRRRTIDVGNLNGERFAVMAGTGLDALMIEEADGGMKDAFGRVAYLWTGAKNLRREPVRTKIRVDGHRWFKGDASCVLVGNVGSVVGGIAAFRDARPDDGRLDVGVVTADGVWQWARTMGRTAFGDASASPFVEMTTARSIEIRLDRKMPYEVDGGDRSKTKRIDIEVEPAAITVCVPEEESA
ncbi:MAG: diacylglycerol/lipid kinase family protein [Actinomycetota bacterium]